MLQRLLKRFFRLAIILVILVGISKYTSIFDNTKIKPYLVNVQTIVQNQVNKVKGLFSVSKTGNNVDNTGDDELSGYNQTGSNSVTGASNFDEGDIIEGSLNADVDKTNLNETGTNPGNKTLRVINCISPRGSFVPKNGFVIAYEAPSSASCKREKRICNNGILEGKYQYDTCFYSNTIAKQQENLTFSENEIAQIEDDFDIASGSFLGIGVQGLSKSQNDPDKHFIGNPIRGIRILPNGRTEINNHILKSNVLKAQLQGIKGQSFITSKTFENYDGYQQKICATPRGTIVPNGDFVTAFKSNTLTNNGTCEAETRFCIDGTLQGSFDSQFCSGELPSMLQGLDLVYDRKDID